MTYLRWAGSKKQILDTLSHAWYATGGQGRYIEAFAGSASLFFYLKPPRAVLIDTNADLQRCMTTIKARPLAVSTLLHRYKGEEAEYYRIRLIDPTQLTSEEQAARFIYLNRYCFNGLYRTNSSGWFNVPFGGYKSGALPTLENLKYHSSLLSSTELVCGDFYAETLKRVSEGDFVYFDPPYAKNNCKLEYQYGPNVFGTKDLERLFDLVQKINDIGAYFVVSYARCQEIETLSNKWGNFPIEVRRTIAASVSKRQFAPELLISNI